MTRVHPPHVVADTVSSLGVRRVTVAWAPPSLAEVVGPHLATLRAAYTRRVLTVELDGRAAPPPDLADLLGPPPPPAPAFAWHRPTRYDVVDRELHLSRPVPPSLVRLALARRPQIPPAAFETTLDLLGWALRPAGHLALGAPLLLALAAAGRLAAPEAHWPPLAAEHPADADADDLTAAVAVAVSLLAAGETAHLAHVAVALGPPHLAARAFAPLDELLAAQPDAERAHGRLHFDASYRTGLGVVSTLAKDPDPCA